MRAAGVHHVIGGAATWPLAARRAATGRMRRIALLMNYGRRRPRVHCPIFCIPEDWVNLDDGGQNIQFEYRWAAADADRMRSTHVNS